MDKALFASYLTPLDPLPTGLEFRGSLDLPVNCLLCDVYGTLFISGSGDISSTGFQGKADLSLQRLLDHYGIAGTPRAWLEKLRAAIIQAHAKARHRGVIHPEIQIEKIWQSILPLTEAQDIRRFATTFEVIVNPVWPMPHALDLIQASRRTGIALGLISNAQFFTPYLFSWFFEQPAEQLGFDPELIFYSFSIGQAKPSMALFDMAVAQLRRMGIPPERVAYVGNDMRNDILPADKAGFQTVLFAGDRRSLRLRGDDPICADLNADLVVSSLEQLISCLTSPLPGSAQ